MTTHATEPAAAVTGPPAWDADTAVEALYAAHWRRLVRLSVLLVGDLGTAEEVVQDAFVSMHGRWRRLRDPDRAAAYLRQAVVNRSRSVLRHRGVVDRHAARERHVDPAPPADGPALAGERREVVLDALRRLPRASARSWPCATTSTCPRPTSPMPSA